MNYLLRYTCIAMWFFTIVPLYAMTITSYIAVDGSRIEASCELIPAECSPENNIFKNSDYECINDALNLNSPYNVNLSYIDPCDGRIIKPENEKLLCVYKKLSDSQSFKTLFINIFGTSEVLNVTIKAVDILPSPYSTANAVTIATPIQDEVTDKVTEVKFDIMVKEQYIRDASSFMLAKTLIHESIHAYLSYSYYECLPQIGLKKLNEMDLCNVLNEYYKIDKFSYSCRDQEQHSFMYDLMIDNIVTILKEVKDSFISVEHQKIAERDYKFLDENNPSSKDFSTSWNWNSFYHYASIAGLDEADGFKYDLFPKASSKYLNYQQYAIEIGKDSFTKNCTYD